MHDVNRQDIESFVNSFLPDFKIPPNTLIAATEYFVEKADSEFLWVRLVENILRGYAMKGSTKGRIFDFLKSLPRELEGLCEDILEELKSAEELDVLDAIKMFQLVFSQRPLTIVELQHALAILYNANFVLFNESCEDNKIWGMEKIIIHCGHNLLETKGCGTRFPCLPPSCV
jgi:hypothetical protein